MVIAFLMMNPYHHKYDRGGKYNGYVAFDKELPLSLLGGADFEDDDSLDYKVHVHGGITFDGQMSDMLDCPIIPLTSIPEPSALKNLRVIGFDTLHCHDSKKYWTLERTKEETLDLMEQINKLWQT